MRAAATTLLRTGTCSLMARTPPWSGWCGRRWRKRQEEKECVDNWQVGPVCQQVGGKGVGSVFLSILNTYLFVRLHLGPKTQWTYKSDIFYTRGNCNGIGSVRWEVVVFLKNIKYIIVPALAHYACPRGARVARMSPAPPDHRWGLSACLAAPPLTLRTGWNTCNMKHLNATYIWNK
jgi:hypothetical protein